jgi:sugar/nucleoside kinase (ribokinase family)
VTWERRRLAGEMLMQQSIRRTKNPFGGSSLCVVGNINRDVKLHGVPPSSGLLRDGETSVSNVTETIGGGGANSACAAAALGARVHFVGKVGADALGEQLRKLLERHGVRTHLARDPNCATGTTAALGFKNGQRHFLSCLPNNQNLRFEDLDLAALDRSRHLLRADVWFSRPMLEQGNRLLFSEARKRKVMTSLDINFDPAWSTGPAREVRHRKHLLKKVLGLVDLAHGNVRELCEFTDCPNLKTALKRLAGWGVGAVVVHLGSKGAGYFRDGRLFIEPADRARRAVHSTGTGDVLSICMILLEARKDLSIQQKLQLSNRVVREFMEGWRTLIPSL